MYLRDIHSAQELRRLPREELISVVSQVRDTIIDTLSSHPGHLASSLGVVELTVALHYVFNTPDDKVVWDVGHQAYAHKILTGRGEQFKTIRTYGGLSGFPKMEESEYDAFGTGHSSTSISAVLGMATASQLQGNKKRCHIAVIGDGAMTGGEAFEALNNVGQSRANILIILNDNGISIDKAVGGLNEHLTLIRTSHRYNRLKNKVWQKLGGDDEENGHQHSIGVFQRITSMMKAMVEGGSNMFESIGIRYFGPVDGHDVQGMVEILTKMKDIEGPKLLHIVTKKGKGLKEAEQDPVVYHSPGIYDIRTGKRVQNKEEKKPLKYQDIFGHTIIELAEKNEKIVGVTPAMATGCSLNMMMEEMPERVFDVGIAEQHAVTFSAGMSAAGMMPFCNIYSSFAQRAYDQIIHDVALQRLPMVICLDRAGLVGEDGPTHHGVFDIASLRPIPNLTICAPMNGRELRHMMYTAQLPNKGTTVIRYPRGESTDTEWKTEMKEIEVGKGRCVLEGKEVAILSIGHPGNDALSAAQELKKRGKDVAVYDMRYVKPLDTALIDRLAERGFKRIVTIEDGVRAGGFGEAVLDYIATKHSELAGGVQIMAIGDEFITHGSLKELKAKCGIDREAIIRVVEAD